MISIGDVTITTSVPLGFPRTRVAMSVFPENREEFMRAFRALRGTHSLTPRRNGKVAWVEAHDRDAGVVVTVFAPRDESGIPPLGTQGRDYSGMRG